MQSNKAPKKTRKITDETVTAAPEISAAAEAAGTPRTSRSSKPKNAETADMGFGSHQHKAGSPAPAEPATAENNTPAAKRMAAAAGADVAAAGQRVVTREDIAALAHSYWAARGYAHGSADADWLRAERELGVSR